MRDKPVPEHAIDTLSADALQNGPNSRTDPRAALAEILARYGYGGAAAEYVTSDLAERGVLLVTEERLAAAEVAVCPDCEALHLPTHRDHAAAIFAVLSAEVTEGEGA